MSADSGAQAKGTVHDHYRIRGAEHYRVTARSGDATVHEHHLSSIGWSAHEHDDGDQAHGHGTDTSSNFPWIVFHGLVGQAECFRTSAEAEGYAERCGFKLFSIGQDRVTVVR